MLRAPICTTSACSAIARAWGVPRNSVTTGSPVSARASARISRPGTPSPLNANGDVRGLNAPPRSIDAPPAFTIRATSSVCSRVYTVHWAAIRQNVAFPPTIRPLTLNVLGSLCLSSSESSLYGREIGTTRSTPGMPSSPSSRTPSGSPIAPIAVVSSPGMTSTWTPVSSKRTLTSSTSASEACDDMTIIIAGSQPQFPHAILPPPEVVGELVADGLGDLGAERGGVAAEVAHERVAVDDDAVGHVVARHAVAVVEPVGAAAPAAVRDHHGDGLERAVELERQVVERAAHD